MPTLNLDADITEILINKTWYFPQDFIYADIQLFIAFFTIIGFSLLQIDRKLERVFLPP